MNPVRVNELATRLPAEVVTIYRLGRELALRNMHEDLIANGEFCISGVSGCLKTISCARCKVAKRAAIAKRSERPIHHHMQWA
eukprot:6000216-Amphidinium_carterae.1